MAAFTKLPRAVKAKWRQPVVCRAFTPTLDFISQHRQLARCRAVDHSAQQLHAGRARANRCFSHSRKLVVVPKAMINVDFASPALVLGAALIGGGIVLLQLRSIQQKISRDADIVVAAMVSIVGSTLIFQGWRLDPLLLLCQALTTAVAVWYGLEAFKLRSKEVEQEERQQALVAEQLAEQQQLQQQQPQQQRREWGQGSEMQPPESYNTVASPGMGQGPRFGYLPPGERPTPPWQTEWQGEAPGRTGWGQARGPLPAQQQQPRPLYSDTIRYDYYGNVVQEGYEEVAQGYGYGEDYGGGQVGAYSRQPPYPQDAGNAYPPSTYGTPYIDRVAPGDRPVPSGIGAPGPGPAYLSGQGYQGRNAYPAPGGETYDDYAQTGGLRNDVLPPYPELPPPPASDPARPSQGPQKSRAQRVYEKVDDWE